MERRLDARGSISGRFRASFLILVLILLVPALASMGMMMTYSQRYHEVIVRMDRISTLSPVVGERLVSELFNAVAGRARFEDGAQYELLNTVNGELDALIAASRERATELVVARRTMNTLQSYVDSLGRQMAAGSTVDEDEQLLEEIRTVTALLEDMLQDAISAEIDFSHSASERIQRVLRVTVALEALLLALACVASQTAQRSLSRAVSRPIEKLKDFAGRIAEGHLDERAEKPGVEELQSLTVSLNGMAQRLSQLMEENRREQENLKKSELRALQAQITPHFLYNTLDAIVWLAEAKRMGEVIAVTRALSDFFRTSLANGQDWIAVAQEREHLQGYLTIQKIRYRDILNYEIHIDEELLHRRVLKLLIQPLVENAIYHGIKNRRGGGRVTVRVWRDGDSLCASVRDDGAGMTPEKLRLVRAVLEGGAPTAESGFGLYSVDKRLRLYYGLARGLQIESAPGEGCEVGFRVPLVE